jgi:phosphoribosyl 1,2-cyclic phosphodiesterase
LKYHRSLTMGLKVTFWGVRGTIACPTPLHMAFGGNTSCVQVEAGPCHLILDAGTGIRELGRRMLQEDVRQADLLFSHTHWDHINGFPFFSPAFRGDRTFRVFAGHLAQAGGIRSTLAGQMAEPVFPVPLEIMHARLDFHDFVAGESFALGEGVAVRTTPLNHPNGATGYRIEHEGRSVCYVTDTEHVPGRPDQRILALIAGADLVIYDSTYTDEEFPEKVGWGHSTWQEGVRLCREAGARRLAIFHHDPDHDDAIMGGIEGEAREAWEGALVAREAMAIELA